MQDQETLSSLTALFPSVIVTQAAQTLAACRTAGLCVTTVESCTGGLIGAALTDIPGSSDVVDRGYVTYSYDAKTVLLGVDAALLQRDGAVSEAVAAQMADGARKGDASLITVAVTGIAGPGGGTPTKPVGLVWMAISSRRGTRVIRNQFQGGRTAVRLQTVMKALEEVEAEAQELARG